MSRSMNPRGGDDKVYTPPELAQAIVEHFKPKDTDLCLEPCRGQGAFLDALEKVTGWPQPYCELDEGIDFLEWQGHVDWVITNPPWSVFRAFLIKSMEIADNVVFLANLNAWMLKARMRDMEKAGFGFKEALLVDTPPKPWPQCGFQLAAVHIQKGWTGPMTFSRLKV